MKNFAAFICAGKTQSSHKVGPRYQYQDTQESVPQTEHKEIHFKCNFLPSYSPLGALDLLQNLMKPLKTLKLYSRSPQVTN